MLAYVTGPEKTSFIYTKYTYSYYDIYLFLCVYYTKFVSFIEFLRNSAYVYDKICVEIATMFGKRAIRIMCIDKTCFLGPGHIL